MSPTESLKPGDVVQIDPTGDPIFGGCFMVVTEPKSFGAQGVVQAPGKDGERSEQTYYRASWKQMEYVGRAAWEIAA